MAKFFENDWGKVKPIAVWAAIALGGAVVISNHFIGQDIQEKIDKNPSVVFNSVASCKVVTNDQKICEESHQIAEAASYALGNRVKYKFKDVCENKHGATCTYFGKNYFPNMVAWQASQDDMLTAMPLYATKDPNTFVRRDGKTFQLSRLASTTAAPTPESSF